MTNGTETRRLNQSRSKSESESGRRTKSESQRANGDEKRPNERETAGFYDRLIRGMHYVRYEMRLLEYPAVGSYYRTPFVLGGYRPRMSVLESVCSLLGRWHNEMLNCWTHVLGCVFLLGLWVHSALAGDSWALQCVPFGGMLTCAGSVLFHTTGCCSHQHYQTGLRCDALSILGTATACQLLPIRLLWEPLPFYQNLHTAVVLVLVTTCAVVATCVRQFHSRDFRPVRATLFIATGLYFLPAVLHALCFLDSFHSPHWFQLSFSVPPAVVEWGSAPAVVDAIPVQRYIAVVRACCAGWLFLLVGTTLLVLRIPERWAPGKLDLGWWSHPIWHVCTVLQCSTHYFAFRYLYANLVIA